MSTSTNEPRNSYRATTTTTATNTAIPTKPQIQGAMHNPIVELRRIDQNDMEESIRKCSKIPKPTQFSCNRHDKKQHPQQYQREQQHRIG